MARAFLSLGTNLGRRADNLDRAIALLATEVGRVVARSAYVTTEPWGFSSPHAFLNAAVAVDTTLSPTALLAATQHIERRMGRTVKTTDGHYHDRIIDIDILTYDRLRLASAVLTLPHPLMTQRDFVMLPLTQVVARLAPPMAEGPLLAARRAPFAM